MIVENQQNIKVHFAAAENNLHFCKLLAGGAKYLLFTVFPLICEHFNMKTINFSKEITNTGKTRFENSNHCIMDSGLFTLMFGSQSGNKDEKFLERWYEHLINYVVSHEYMGTCVEVDCQKIFGPQKAWEFRERMRADLPNNRVINVFHKEDGKKGLEQMIEFSDYIAISVPELRAIGQKKYVYDIAYFIKNKKPSIDIHLLGCTELEILRRLKFCTSADSTSWNSCVRYGFIIDRNGKKRHISTIKPEAYMDYISAVRKFKNEFNVPGEKEKNEGILAFQVNVLKILYASVCGNQD